MKYPLTEPIELIPISLDDNELFDFDEYRKLYTQTIATCFGIPLHVFYSPGEILAAIMKAAGVKNEIIKEVQKTSPKSN